MDFYKVLEEIMESKKLKASDVARICGLPSSTVRSILNRKNKTVALDVAVKISRGLNVPLEELNDGLGTSTITETHIELINKTEEDLIKVFNNLNDIGKKEAFKRIEELTELNKYSSNMVYTLAAHDDDLTHEEKGIALEMAKKAFEEMDK